MGWTYKAMLRVGDRNGGGYVRIVEGSYKVPIVARPTSQDDTLPDAAF